MATLGFESWDVFRPALLLSSYFSVQNRASPCAYVCSGGYGYVPAPVRMCVVGLWLCASPCAYAELTARP